MKGETMAGKDKAVYSYVYLPEYVKPWAMSCLEHLVEDKPTRFEKYEVKVYKDYDVTTELKFEAYKHQLWVFLVEEKIKGVCLTSRVNLPKVEKVQTCVSLQAKHRLDYLAHLKEDVWVVCQCCDFLGIKEDNWPFAVNKLKHVGVLDIVHRYKQESALLLFQEDTKEDFEFEEND